MQNEDELTDTQVTNDQAVQAAQPAEKPQPYAEICPARDNADHPAAEAESAVEEQSASALSTGKFRDVGALWAAYQSLEAEFTRRSQRLKELEENKAQTPSPTVPADEGLIAAALANEKVKGAVVAEYLKGIFAGKGVPYTVGGVPCTAPKCEPKSVKEAGALAKQFLKD